MKVKKAIVFIVICFGLIGASTTNLGFASTNQTDTALQDVLDRGYLIVGSDTTYAPFESLDPETSIPEGFDVDLAVEVAHAMGVDVVIKTSDWVPIIPNLLDGQFDVIISAMTITAEREEQVDFTRWYYQSFQGILVEDGNPLSITDVTDLETTVTVGFQSGTTSHLYFNETLEPAGATGSSFDDVPTAIAALKQGNVDAVLGDIAVLIEAAAETTGIETVNAVFSPENFGFATRPADDSLTDKLNEILNTMLGSDQNSPSPSDEYLTIYNKWFSEGPVPDYIDRAVTNAALNSVVLYTDVPATSPGFELIAIVALIPITVLAKRRK